MPTDHMNNPDESLLWSRLQQFSFDDPQAENPFSYRLAREQKWPKKFTKRVIGEYRKFLFLCCVSPTGITPSKIVDEAWHLHLTYSHSYWMDLCKNTLGRDIHHYPSKGGEEEMNKFERWYNETLRLYKLYFATDPPEDIWPHAEDAPATMKVPLFSHSNGLKLAAIILLCLPFLLSTFYYHVVFPFHLGGSRFLGFYGLLCLMAIAFYYLMNKAAVEIISLHIQRNIPGNISVFQIAGFLRGRDRAVQTCIVDLVCNGLLIPRTTEKLRIISTDFSLADKQNPFVEFLRDYEEGDELNYKEISKNWYRKEKFTHPVTEQMKKSGIWRTSRKILLVVLVLLAGIARLLQASPEEDWASEYISLIMFVFVILIGIIEFNMPNENIDKRVEAGYREWINAPESGRSNVVTNFALNGDAALKGVRGRTLLATIFYGPVLPKIKIEPNNADCGCGCN